MALEHVTDHVAKGLGRLIQRFKGKPYIAAVVSAPLVQVQELEDALWSLIAGRALSTAIGVQLDGLGAIVGEARIGLGDEDYRALIRARIAANRSDGQGDTLLRVARLVSGSVDVAGVPNPTLFLREYFPGSVLVEAGSTSTDPGVSWYTATRAGIVIRLLDLAASAGVAVFFVWAEVPDGFALTLGAAADYPEADDPQGLGDNTDADVGGEIAAVLGG